MRYAALLATILAACVTVDATTVQRLTFDDLVMRSRSVVMGRVLHSRSRWDAAGRIILTDTAIEVSETLKGSESGIVTVTTVGGRVGDTLLHVAGMPQFTPGEDTVVFLETTGVFNTILGLSQGKFSVDKGEVLRNTSGLTFEDGKHGTRQKLTLDEFRTAVRQRIGRQR